MKVYQENTEAILRPPIEDMPGVFFGGPEDGKEVMCDPRREEFHYPLGSYRRSGFVTKLGGGEAIYMWGHKRLDGGGGA